MAIAVQTPATKRVPMDPMRKTALAAGGFYLITIITSIPALVLYGPVSMIASQAICLRSPA